MPDSNDTTRYPRLAMRMYDRTAAVVPRGKSDAAVATVVIYIFESAHHEWDATEAETETDDSSPTAGTSQ